MTRAVNIKDSEYDVYCGRAGRYYGNLHSIGSCKICNKNHHRAECIAAFKIDFDKRIVEDEEYRKKVLELKGKRLLCFYKSNLYEVECHCDVFKNWLDKN